MVGRRSSLRWQGCKAKDAVLASSGHRALSLVPSRSLHRPASLAVYGNDVSNQSWTGKDTAGATVTIPYSYPGGYWRNVVEALAWTTFACSAAAGLAGLIMYS